LTDKKRAPLSSEKIRAFGHNSLEQHQILELTGTILLFSEKYGKIRVSRNLAAGGKI